MFAQRGIFASLIKKQDYDTTWWDQISLLTKIMYYIKFNQKYLKLYISVQY